ncbi:hypothetical protein DLAC_00292 [Tieghemostelium lacteum]|uniref:Generative cell specific-1/HAP2 domain-containing protein n=1 Tax=Tieghemostelium lacteum TaxID=361077 RepID=A0A152A9C9_TIELA|nr:hypothetical protein DLAC_00292 [Tieghemostelium lacteum]|eukprot:KYR02826.1 hypothetical protein DLAC_00292 [Tieghemostelium lacteum]
MKTFKIFIIFLFITIFLNSNIKSSNIIGSSKIQKCIRNGATQEPSETCDLKIVVAMTLNSNQFTVDTVIDEEDGNKNKTVQTPIIVSFEMSKVSQVCSFKYEFSSAYEAIESIIYKNDYLITSGPCDKSESSTCGSIDGVRDSQGFCCRCSGSDYLGPDQNSRGNLECELFSSKSASAHCLSFSNQYFHIFSVQECKIQSTITANIRYMDPISQVYKKEKLQISPTSPIATAQGVLLELEGNFMPVVQFKNYESDYIAVPEDNNDPISQLPFVNKTMILDRSLFDKTGLTCNKIGVSYSAFQNQPNRCQAEFKSCLRNQLKDYFEKGTHFISSLGEITRLHQSSNQNIKDLYLALVYPHNVKSLVTLNIVADNMVVTENISPGIIPI